MKYDPETVRQPDAGSAGDREAREIEDLVKLYTLIWNRFVACQMMPAVFDQTTIDIEAGRVGLRATGQVIKFAGFLEVYAETEEDAAAEDESHRQPARREGGRGAAAARGQARAALHPAAAALHRGDAGQGARGEGHRPAVDLRGHPVDHPGRGYVEKKEARFHPTELGVMVNGLLVKSFPDIVSTDFTAADGGAARPGRGGAPGLGAPAAGLLRAVQDRPRQGQDRDARRQARGDADRARLREVRQAHGHQVGPQRPLPGLLRLPRVPQHQGVHPRPPTARITVVATPPARPTRSARPAARRW